MQQDFVPRPDADFLTMHDQFKAGLASLGADFGVTPAEITEITNDNTALHNKSTASSTASAAAKSATADFRAVRLPAEKRLRNLARRIKPHPAYTAAKGQTLAIIGPEDTTDLTTAKPTLTIVSLGQGVTEISFNKSVSSGVAIYTQRGGETAWSFLTRDTNSPYVDNRALLVPGQPELRRYRAKYLSGDEEVGLWSDDASGTAQP